ncbi:hypothetical protein AAC387_Pa10g1999 [Persea americana]
MGQIGEEAESRGYWVGIEAIPSKVEFLQATKLKEAGVYSTIDPANFSIPTAAEIESNHITHCLITSDAFPRAAISVRVPRIEP